MVHGNVESEKLQEVQRPDVVSDRAGLLSVRLGNSATSGASDSVSLEKYEQQEGGRLGLGGETLFTEASSRDRDGGGGDSFNGEADLSYVMRKLRNKAVRAAYRAGYQLAQLRCWWKDELSERNRRATKNWVYGAATLTSIGLTLGGFAQDLRIGVLDVSALVVGASVAVVAERNGRKLHDCVIEERWIREMDLQIERIRQEELRGLRAYDPNTLPWQDESLKIIRCLKRYGVDVSVTNSDEGLTLTRFMVLPSGLDDGIAEIQSRANELQMALRAPKRPDIHGTPMGVAIDVPLDENKRKPALFWQYVVEGVIPDGGVHIPIGVTFDKQVVTMNLANPSTPHLLVAGTTGSGKSETTRNIIFGLATWYHAWIVQVVLLDPKREFRRDTFDRLDILKNHSQTRRDIERALITSEEEMDRRKVLLEDYQDITDYNLTVGAEFALPHLVIVVDELPEVCDIGEAKSILSRIARLGRSLGVHLICNAQRPSADIIPTQLRANLPVKLMLKVASVLESYIITGNDEDGRGYYLCGKGDMWYLDFTDNGKRLQGFYLPPSKYNQVPADIKGEIKQEQQVAEAIEEALTEIPGLGASVLEPTQTANEALLAKRKLFTAWKASRESESLGSKTAFATAYYQIKSTGPKFTQAMNEIDAVVDDFAEEWLREIPLDRSVADIILRMWGIPNRAGFELAISKKAALIKEIRDKQQAEQAEQVKAKALPAAAEATPNETEVESQPVPEEEEVIDVTQLSTVTETELPLSTETEAETEAEGVDVSASKSEPVTKSSNPAIEEQVKAEVKEARQVTRIYDFGVNPNAMDEVLLNIDEQIASLDIEMQKLGIGGAPASKVNSQSDLTKDVWD